MPYKWDENKEIAKATMFYDYEAFSKRYPEAVSEGVTYESFRKKRKRMLDNHQVESAINVNPEDIPVNIRAVFLNEQGAEEIDYNKFLELAPQIQEFFDKIDPITVYEPILIPTDRPIVLVQGSCLHVGGRYTFHKTFQDRFHQILDAPGLYWGSLGDEIEGFYPTFFSKEAVTNQLFPRIMQLKALEGILDALAARNKLLYGTTSQHGAQWEEKLTGENSVKPMYLDRGVPFFDGMGQIDLQVGDFTYHIGFSHKLPGYSMYNPLHPHIRALRERWPNADIIIQGDRHIYGYSKQLTYVEEYDAGRRNSPWVHFIQAGTAKAGLDKYTIRGWSHGVFEWPFILLHPDEYGIRVTNEWQQVLEWLHYYYGYTPND